jgi:hypothetical protein
MEAKIVNMLPFIGTSFSRAAIYVGFLAGEVKMGQIFSGV